MSKRRTVFTSITALPPNISRETVLEFLHNHGGMIDLNPLVTERHVISPPVHALPEERVCVWYSITDKISYLPGGLVTGAVSYTAAFHDLPNGIQTHCHAPMGVDIREKWTLGGTLPGEPPEPIELGLQAPRTGLYIREDVELTCNLVVASFIKKTIKKAHGTLVDTLTAQAKLVTSEREQGLASPISPLRIQGHYRQQSFQQPFSQQKTMEKDRLMVKPLPPRPTSWGAGPPTPSGGTFSYSNDYPPYGLKSETPALEEYGYRCETPPRPTYTPPLPYVPELQGDSSTYI